MCGKGTDRIAQYLVCPKTKSAFEEINDFPLEAGCPTWWAALAENMSNAHITLSCQHMYATVAYVNTVSYNNSNAFNWQFLVDTYNMAWGKCCLSGSRGRRLGKRRGKRTQLSPADSVRVPLIKPVLLTSVVATSITPVASWQPPHVFYLAQFDTLYLAVFVMLACFLGGLLLGSRSAAKRQEHVAPLNPVVCIGCRQSSRWESLRNTPGGRAAAPADRLVCKLRSQLLAANRVIEHKNATLRALAASTRLSDCELAILAGHRLHSSLVIKNGVHNHYLAHSILAASSWASPLSWSPSGG